MYLSKEPALLKILISAFCLKYTVMDKIKQDSDF